MAPSRANRSPAKGLAETGAHQLRWSRLSPRNGRLFTLFSRPAFKSRPSLLLELEAKADRSRAIKPHGGPSLTSNNTGERKRYGSQLELSSEPEPFGCWCLVELLGGPASFHVTERGC